MCGEVFGMKFWTALQDPLSQAVLVDNGKIVCRIPEKPPGTLVRRVKCLGESGGDLIVGRRNSIERWKSDGSEMISSYYHPYIYGIHEICEYGDKLIVGCAGLDVVFMLDSDSNVVWEWWASGDGYRAVVKEVFDENWPVMQLTSDRFDFLKGESHLNSVRIFGNDLLVSLLSNKVIVKLGIGSSKSEFVSDTLFGVHSPILLKSGELVYGCDNGIVLPGGRIIEGYEWVKRIYETSEGNLLFTHERGVTCINLSGEILDHIPLPRPFGISLLSV